MKGTWTMTERRPHWDDYLLASVMIHCNDIYQCHAVIAAVEDWQKRQDIGGDWGTVAWSVRMYQHYVTSEAAIARVREVHRPSQSTIWSHDLQQAITVTTCHCGSEQYPCPTIKAIDGERDE